MSTEKKNEQYRVKALSMNGENGKIYSAGEIINAGEMPEGRAEEMVSQGFLVIHDGPQVEETGTTTVKHIVTAADIARVPLLTEQGFKEGDELELPHVDYAMVDALSLPKNEDGTEHGEGRVLVSAADALDPKGPVYSEPKEIVPEPVTNAISAVVDAIKANESKNKSKK